MKESLNTRSPPKTAHPPPDAVVAGPINGRGRDIDVVRGCFGDRKVFLGKVLGVSRRGQTYFLPVYVRLAATHEGPRIPAARKKGATALACILTSITGFCRVLVGHVLRLSTSCSPQV